METIKVLLFLLVLGVPVFAGGLLVVGGGDGEFESESIVRISRPSREVFEWIVDADQRRKWMAGMERSSQDARNDFQVGVKLRETFDVDGMREERDLHVMGYDDGKLLSYRTTMGGVPVELRYEFGAYLSGKQCVLKVHYKAQYEGWWAKLTEPFQGNRLRGHIEGDLEALKAKIEVSLPDR